MSPVPDAVSPVPDAVSDTGESSTGDNADTAKPKATSKRRGKSKAKAKKADAASTDSARDDDAAHAEFIAQFPTTDPDAMEAEATSVSDVTSNTNDSETVHDPAASFVDVSADNKTETVAAPSETAEASEAEVDASTDAGDGEAEKESVDNDVAEHATAVADVTGSDGTETAEADDEGEAAGDDAESDAVAATPETASAESSETADTAATPETATPAAEEHAAAAPTLTPVAAALDPDVDGTDDPDEALLDDDDDVSSWVRPYVWTGGRTESTTDFAVETLVSAREQVAGAGEAMRDEHRRVLELCDEPRSVTEIAALLSVPLGVAKTLLGAMVEDDLVVVHRNNGSAAGPDLALMERVLRGLKKL